MSLRYKNNKFRGIYMDILLCEPAYQRTQWDMPYAYSFAIDSAVPSTDTLFTVRIANMLVRHIDFGVKWQWLQVIGKSVGIARGELSSGNADPK